MQEVAVLKKRKEFLAVSRAQKKWVTPAFILQARLWDAGESHGCTKVRFGLTASKKTGHAVRRNRIRRRLRSLAHEVFPLYSQKGCDFVLIARYASWDKEYAQLQSDLHKALLRLGFEKWEL